jgi:hypothetical protein
MAYGHFTDVGWPNFRATPNPFATHDLQAFHQRFTQRVLSFTHAAKEKT